MSPGEDRNQSVLNKLTEENFPIDRYEPLKLLGEGASGNVYLCKDKKLGKQVAVKTASSIFSSHLFDFQREAKATSKLSHPNIVTVFDCGIANDTVPYIAMEHIDGLNLHQYQDLNHPLTVYAVLEIYSKIAGALDYAHDNGILHRDLKPENIIILDDGENLDLKVIDFGIAHMNRSTQETTLSQGMTLVGTPAYMAPDPAQNRAYDSRSEVYSLGCMLFESLSGQPPYKGESAMDTILKHAEEPQPKLSEVTGEQFHQGIEELVAKCMAKDPDERFHSMGELEKALESLLDKVLEDEEIEENTASTPTANPIPAGTPSSNTSQPRSRTMFANILATVSILTLGIVIGYFIGKADNNAGTEPAAKTKTLTASKVIEDRADKLPDSIKQFGGLVHWSLKPDENGDMFYTSSYACTDKELDELQFADFEKAPRVRVTRTKQLTGEGFAKLRNFPIIVLVVHSEALTDKGLKAICGIKALKVLALVNVDNLSTEGFKALKDAKELEYLFLIQSDLPANCIATISELTELKSLGLERIDFLPSDSVEDLAKLPNLEELKLTRAEFDDTDFLLRQPKLTKLGLNRTNTDDGDMADISKLKLTELDLSRSDISIKSLKYFNRMKTLEKLTLSLRNGITRDAIRNTIHLPKCIVEIDRESRRWRKNRRARRTQL